MANIQAKPLTELETPIVLPGRTFLFFNLNDAGLLYTKDELGTFTAVDTVGGGPAGPAIIDKTYSEMQTLASTDMLEPGQYYRITDHATTHPVHGLAALSSFDDMYTAPIEPLVVWATSPSEIDLHAYSAAFPQDEIFYDFHAQSFYDFNNSESFNFANVGVDAIVNIGERSIELTRAGITSIPIGNLIIQLQSNAGAETFDLGTLFLDQYFNTTDYEEIKVRGNKIFFSANVPIDFANISNLDIQTSQSGAALQGRIYRRRDTSLENNFPYDYRNVKFRRYRVDLGNVANFGVASGFGDDYFAPVPGSYNIGGVAVTLVQPGDFRDLKLCNEFSMPLCRNNYMGDYSDNVVSVNGSFFLSNKWGMFCFNNTFYGVGLSGLVFDNEFGSFMQNNTIRNAQANRIKTDQFADNIFEGFTGNVIMSDGVEANVSTQGFDSNTLNAGASFRDNTFTGGFTFNDVSNAFTGNVFAMDAEHNMFFGAVYTNTFNGSTRENIFHGQVSTVVTTATFISNTCLGGIGQCNFLNSCNNNVFGATFSNNDLQLCESNIFGAQCTDNDFSNVAAQLLNNHIGPQFQLNVSTGVFSGNVIGDNCTNNTTGSFFSNHILSGFSGNVLANGFSGNSIGNGFTANTTLLVFAENVIANSFSGNASIGANFRNNTIGDAFVNNGPIGSNFQDNTIAHDFNLNVSIGNNFRDNHIGNDFSANTINVDFDNNVIHNSFLSNTTSASGFSANQVGNECDNNIFGGQILNNVIDQDCSGNTFTGMSTCRIGANCDSNVFSGALTQNVIGDFCQSNSFAGSMSANVIGSSFTTNVIVGTNFRNNTILHPWSGNTGIQANFENNIMRAGISAAVYTAATHVYAAYTCELYQNPVADRLRYTDGADTIIYTALNA